MKLKEFWKKQNDTFSNRWTQFVRGGVVVGHTQPAHNPFFISYYYIYIVWSNIRRNDSRGEMGYKTGELEEVMSEDDKKQSVKALYIIAAALAEWIKDKNKAVKRELAAPNPNIGHIIIHKWLEQKYQETIDEITERLIDELCPIKEEK